MMSQGDSSSASLLFLLMFFVLAVSLPLGVAALCVYEFARPKLRATVTSSFRVD